MRKDEQNVGRMGEDYSYHPSTTMSSRAQRSQVPGENRVKGAQTMLCMLQLSHHSNTQPHADFHGQYLGCHARARPLDLLWYQGDSSALGFRFAQRIQSLAYINNNRSPRGRCPSVADSSQRSWESGTSQGHATCENFPEKVIDKNWNKYLFFFFSCTNINAGVQGPRTIRDIILLNRKHKVSMIDLKEMGFQKQQPTSRRNTDKFNGCRKTVSDQKEELNRG